MVLWGAIRKPCLAARRYRAPLDKDTSGLMLVARERATMDALVRLIAQRQVSRQYLCVGASRVARSTLRTVDGGRA